jgi:uncharacterized protein YbjT (DUF2867 family)
MRILVTGASGYVGASLIPRLRAAGHEVRAFARAPARVPFTDLEVVQGDAVTGAGLAEAMQGVDVAYYLMHSMETAANGLFVDRELMSAENVAAAVRAGRVRRVVYLGGPVPRDGPISPHLASRLEVERVLLGATPESVALRASIVIGAHSRSFRFLVRLVERLPVIPLPPWSRNRTRPIDGRDVLTFLERAADHPAAAGRSLDIAGPDLLTYGGMIERIRDHMLLGRPVAHLPVTFADVAPQIAAAVAGEDPGLVAPLMGSLGSDLLPREGHDTAALLGVRLHRFDAAVERALREWEAEEELAAR